MQDDFNSPFRSVFGLGALKSQHKPSSFNRWAGLIFSVFFIAAGPLLVLLAAYLAYDAYTRYGISRADDSGFWLPLVGGVIGGLLGLWGLYSAWRNWPLAVALYDNGFAYNDRKGLKQISWADIDSVWQSITKHYRYGIHVSTTYLYTIETKDKSRILLDNKLKKVEDLGKATMQGSAATLFPRYWQALQSGQRVTFGKLALDTSAIYSGDKSLLWSEIKAIRIQQGIIFIKKEGGWFNWGAVSVAQVPNFYVFYDLVSRFAKIE